MPIQQRMGIVRSKQQLVSIDANLVAISQRPTGCNLSTIDRDPVATVSVFQDELLTDDLDAGMNSRHSRIVKHDLALASITPNQGLPG